MVCFDTTFLVALVRRDPKAEKKLEEYVAGETKMSTTPITACELFKGAYRSGREESIRKVRKALTHLEVLDFSVESCERFGRLANDLRAKGVSIGDLDTMIASIALAHGESLLTSDEEHFERVPGLTVETW